MLWSYIYLQIRACNLWAEIRVKQSSKTFGAQLREQFPLIGWELLQFNPTWGVKAKDLSSQVATGQTPWASSRNEQAVGTKLQDNGIDKNSLASPSEGAQWGYRDGLEGKSTYCSCRGRQFSSQQPRQWITTTYNSSSRASDSLIWPLWALHSCVYAHTHRHISFFKNK